MVIFGNMTSLEFVSANTHAYIFDFPVNCGLKVMRPRWTGAGFETPSEGVGP